MKKVNRGTVIDMPWVVQDLATQWIQSLPCKTKMSKETQKSLMKFLEPKRKPEVINTDNSSEFGKACEDLCWNHCTSTPHRSETNGIAERAVCRVKEGTSAVLLQSSLDEKWWAEPMECYCYLRNIQDLMSGGKTPYERRFGEPLKGPSFRLVHWLSIILLLQRANQESINLERKSYLDCSSDMYCSLGIGKEIFGLQTLGAGNFGRVGNLRSETQCKGDCDAENGESFIFLIADGTVKLSG